MTLLLYQLKIYIYIFFKRSKNRKKITTCINICVSNTHLNIRKNYLHTISGSGSIETHFRRLAWPLCRWFCLEAQSFVTDFTSVNEQQ